MNDQLLQLALRLASDVDIPTSSNGAALIAGGSAVAVALIYGYIGTRGRNESRQRRRDHRPSLAELDAAHVENKLHDAEARIDVLCRFLWIRRYDPNLIVDGTEGDRIVKRRD